MGKEINFEENKMFLCIILQEFQWQVRLAKTGEGKERYFITISQDNSLKIKSSFYQIPQEYLRQFLDYFWDYDEVLTVMDEKRRGRTVWII